MGEIPEISYKIEEINYQSDNEIIIHYSDTTTDHHHFFVKIPIKKISNEIYIRKAIQDDIFRRINNPVKDAIKEFVGKEYRYDEYIVLAGVK